MTLSFDGKGINGPDEYRSRLATFTSDKAATEYGALFEASPALLAALKAMVSSRWLSIDADINRTPEAVALRSLACAAIDKAEGGAA